MKFKNFNRQFLFAAIIVFYLIPLLFFSAYSITLMSHNKSWTLLSLGLLLVVFGTLSLIFLLSYWEQSLRSKDLHNPLLISQQSSSPLKKEATVTVLNPSLTFDSLQQELMESIGIKENAKELNLLQTTLHTTQKQEEELFKILEMKEQELQKQEEENQRLQNAAKQIAQDFADYKLFSEEQLKQKHLQLGSLQQIVEDQRAEMEKRQEQIHQLDTKVHDLSYEIKTLLYLHEEETSPSKSSLLPFKEEKVSSFSDVLQAEHRELPVTVAIHPSFSQESNEQESSTVRNSVGAIQLLKKSIQMAQKLTGANYYGNESSRYREFSSSYFAIDQRRLFDSLRSETGALLVVYSQKDHKLLFANSESKSMLGWSPEKFLADFVFIMQEGIQDWKKALQMLSTTSEAHARLLAKTKQGQEILLNCHLGAIPSGLFRNYVIGVLYPT